MAADVALITIRSGRFSVLLIQRSEPAFRERWALPGSFLRPKEDVDDAAARVLCEATRVVAMPAGVHLEQLRTYGALRRDQRVGVLVVYVAFASDLPESHAGLSTDGIRHWPVCELAWQSEAILAFDHARIIADAIERARSKIEYTSLATRLLAEPFSLAELRAVYEEVWGRPQDPSNFRRKVLRQRGFLVPAGAAQPASRLGGRPAELYRSGPAMRLWPPLRRGTL